MSIKRLSKKNQYWLQPYREKELLYFVRQYTYWKDELKLINLTGTTRYDRDRVQGGEIPDPTFAMMCIREDLKDKIRMVDDTANDVDPVIGPMIVLGIANKYNYDNLKLMHDIPCCREVYYKMYHEFLWRLDKLRN